ncbi:MAG: DUF2318 domain-containing protein [bacterium]|nr:DUF2318 domain-containing protein [bacterium]
MKKITLIILIIMVLIIGAWLFLKSSDNSFSSLTQCKEGDTNCAINEGGPIIRQSENPSVRKIKFIGNKGENTVLINKEIRLDAPIFNDNQARFYNVEMPDGKTIYFFVLKDKNGIYRAAANACQVCFLMGKGFHQEGDEIVCDNCGNRYPVEKIATEKGGCNPGPINPNLEVENGKITIKQADIEQVVDLF